MVLRLLHGLPLALRQAGLYMRETNMSAAKYAEHYKRTWDLLMKEEDCLLLDGYGDRSVWTTWKLPYEQVQRQSRKAACMLKLWGFLDSREVRFELMAACKELAVETDVPTWLLEVGKDELVFSEVMMLLSRYSLVDGQDGTDGYSMHPVLHRWCRELAEGEERYALGRIAAALTKQMTGDSDTLVDPSVSSIQHQAVSTEVTLVNADLPHPESVNFTMYNYQRSLAGSPEDDDTDIESIVSRDDVSQAGTTASIVAYQHVATDIIKKALLGDTELFCTYKEAVKRVGQDRFLRNNCKLLQWLSKDLRTSQLLPSEQLAVRFLGGYRGSRLVCTAICHDLVEAQVGHQKQLPSEPDVDKETMLNRFLNEMDSAQQFENSETPQASYRNDRDSSDNEDDEEFEESGMEALEATIQFLLSGQPFQVYKRRLNEWLHPPLPVNASTQDDPEKTGFSSTDIAFVPELAVSAESTNVLFVDHGFFQHTEHNLDRAEGYNLPGTKSTVTPILSNEGDVSNRYKSLESYQSLAAPAQSKTNIHDPVLSLSLPLLVDKILRNLNFPVLEPGVREGRTRVYWTSVRCNVQSLGRHTNVYTRVASACLTTMSS